MGFSFRWKVRIEVPSRDPLEKAEALYPPIEMQAIDIVVVAVVVVVVVVAVVAVVVVAVVAVDCHPNVLFLVIKL